MRLTIIGGGSYQWVPRLVADIATTPSLQDSQLTLEDIDPARLESTTGYARHLARLLRIPLAVHSTTNQRAALEGAQAVIVNISTGGLQSMAIDLTVPERYGIRHSVGDTVGPGGINRCLRNVPVLVGIARDMSELCLDAWMLNLTNPMTTLCRAVSGETSVKVVGLCHEVLLTRFSVALLLGMELRDVHLEVAGINHLPIAVRVDAGGDDGLQLLVKLARDKPELDRPFDFPLPTGVGHDLLAPGAPFTRRALLDANQLKLELLSRFGALPAAGDRHLAEFFPGFLTRSSGWGQRWGVRLTSIADRQSWERSYYDDLVKRLASTTAPTMPSGELVAPLLDSLITGKPRRMPLNLPNTGQCPDLPEKAVVESTCLVDDRGIRPLGPISVPPLLAEYLRRVSASQELAVRATLSGDPDTVFAAMLADPLASRIDYDLVSKMTSEMLSASAPWLPQFMPRG